MPSKLRHSSKATRMLWPNSWQPLKALWAPPSPQALQPWTPMWHAKQQSTCRWWQHWWYPEQWWAWSSISNQLKHRTCKYCSTISLHRHFWMVATLMLRHSTKAGDENAHGFGLWHNFAFCVATQSATKNGRVRQNSYTPKWRNDRSNTHSELAFPIFIQSSTKGACPA